MFPPIFNFKNTKNVTYASLSLCLLAIFLRWNLFFDEFCDWIEENVYNISNLNVNTTCECQQYLSASISVQFILSLLRFALTAQLI